MTLGGASAWVRFQRGPGMRCWLAFLAAAALAAGAARAGVRLEWDPANARLIEEGATYGRIKRLDGNTLLLCSEKRGRSWVRRGNSEGTAWEPPVLAATNPHGSAANPELCVLRDGTVLLAWNNRPRPDGGPHRYSIQLARSRDGGRTWKPDPGPVFAGGTVGSDGVWEPALLELPGGELQLFFADEASVGTGQQITVMSSRDHGATWGAPRRACFRDGHRDGMPVPALLDGRIAIAIEDNGLPGPDGQPGLFRPTLVTTALDKPWLLPVQAGHPDRWAALAVPPPEGSDLGAPYLCALPGGGTVLSVQSNEDDRRWHRCAVYVGDDQGRRFAQRSLPFGLPPESSCLWNSLFVRDARTVLALGDVRLHGRRGLWLNAGRVVRAP